MKTKYFRAYACIDANLNGPRGIAVQSTLGNKVVYEITNGCGGRNGNMRVEMTPEASIDFGLWAIAHGRAVQRAIAARRVEADKK